MATEQPSDNPDPEQLTLSEQVVNGNGTNHSKLTGFFAYGRTSKQVCECLTYARETLDRTDLDDDRINETLRTGEMPLKCGIRADDETTYPKRLNEAIEQVLDHDVPNFVVTSLDALSDNWRDVHAVVNTITDGGTTVHAIHDDLVIASGSGELDALRVVAESEREDALDHADHRLQARETGEWTGRPPIGHTVENGVLMPGDGYDDLVAALEQVDSDPDKTVYWASKVTGHSRDSINRALTDPNRRELYGLGPLNEE